MKKIVLLLLLITMVVFSTAVQAETSTVPNTAFFLGVGVGYNGINFGDQHNYAQGTSNITNNINGNLFSTGFASGDTDFSTDPQSRIAPSVQAGYFQHFKNSDYLWGAKFSYSYINSSSTINNQEVPQAGTFANPVSGQPAIPFTGNVIVRSYENRFKQQLALMPFIGRSFEKQTIYLGAGPTLSETETMLNNVVGLAKIGDKITNITGESSNFSSSDWVWGGSAIVGTTYFIDSSWFIDANYTYGIIQNKKNSYATPFDNPAGWNTTNGTLSGTYGGNIVSQAFVISINKAF